MSYMLISFADDFSRTPGARHVSDGPFSGEAFRNTLLIPALKCFDVVTIDLNGVYGFSMSFLDEAFGVLLENGSYSYDELLTRLNFICDDEMTISEIMACMKAHD